MRTRRLKLCTLVLLVHCTGTDTGNSVVPEGAKLVRSQLAREVAPQVSQEVVDQLGRDNRDFAFALYREVARDGDQNLFFSPYSLSEALAMLYAGARGATAEEMKSALRLELPQEQLHRAFNAVDAALAGRGDELSPAMSPGEDAPEPGDGLRLEVSKAAFVPRGETYAPDYLDLLARNYGAGLYAVDFARQPAAAERNINDWFAEQTEGRIQQLLPAGALLTETRLVLANAIYFKAHWRDRFKNWDTRPLTFHAVGGDVTVQMMGGHHQGKYTRGEGYQALQLEYVSTAVAMLFVLPDEGQFKVVEDGFDRAFIDQVRSELVMPVRISATVPRFRYRASLDAGSALRALGMSGAFSPGADFSGIGPSLQLQAVLHQASIAIDEDGTEAAAGTSTISGSGGIDPTVPVVIVLDRPFLFLVYDAPTGQVLFLGRLTDPTR